MRYHLFLFLIFGFFNIADGQISISKDGDQLLFKGKNLDNRKYSNIYINDKQKYALVTFDSANKSYTGCYNFKGKLIIPPKYGEISTLKDNKKQLYFQVSEEVSPGNYLFGLFDFEGKIIIPTQFSSFEITSFESNEERILVNRLDASGNYKYGIYSLQGKELLPAIYDELTINFDEILKINYATVKLDGKIGIFSIDGQQIVPTLYKSIDYVFIEDENQGKIVENITYFRALNDDLTFLYDNNGKLISGQGWNKIMVEICGGRRLMGVSKMDKNGIMNYGFVDRISGAIITPCKYDEWISMGNDVYKVTVDGKIGLVNDKGEILKPDSLELTFSTDSGNCVFTVESIFQKVYLSSEGRWLDGKYDFIEEQWPYLMLQNTGDSSRLGKVKVYNLQTRIFFNDPFDDFMFSYVPNFQEKKSQNKNLTKHDQYFATASIKGQWYTLNGLNKTLIPGNWDRCKYKTKDLLEVTKDNKMGIMKTNGAFILKPIYHSITDFPSKIYNHYIVKLEHHDSAKSALFNNKGKQLTPFEFDDFKPFSFHDNITVALAKKDNRVGLIDVTGKKIVDCKYEKIDILNSSITYSLFVYSQNGKQGLFDSKGLEILPSIYDYISMSENDEIKLGKDNLYGMCNKKGEIFIPLEYSDPFYFYNGKASVKKGSENFYINKKNKRIPIF